MKLICPICCTVQEQWANFNHSCIVCKVTLLTPFISGIYDDHIQANAVINIGSFRIEGNCNGVSIQRIGVYGLSYEFVSSPDISIAHFAGLSLDLLQKFIRDKDWSRLEKSKNLL